MTSVYQFINKKINYNTKKFADTSFLTVWDGNRINYGKKYGYIKSSDLISELETRYCADNNKSMCVISKSNKNNSLHTNVITKC